MAMMKTDITLVVTTLGRDFEVERLLTSLDVQSYHGFDVTLVDQNQDRRATAIAERRTWSFPITTIHCPDERGVSRGRNIGWKAASGAVIMFPDDDCWFPGDFMARAMEAFARADADLLCGRVANEAGVSVNGRFSVTGGEINRSNVWISQCEGVTFVRRSLLSMLGGYDETLGIGAPTPWQAAEGPDFILRALRKNARCYYDPTLYGFHNEIDIVRPSRSVIRKLRGYACGMGFVLRRHGYGPTSLSYWVARSLLNALRSLLCMNIPRARCYLAVASGRISGWLAHGAP